MADDLISTPNSPRFGVQGGPNTEGGGKGILSILANYHQAQEQRGAQNLDRMLLAADKGFPVDPRAVTKAAKKAGIPLMNGEQARDMVQGHQPQQQGKSGAAQPPENDGTQSQKGSQPDPYNVAAISDVKQRQKVETNHAVDGIIRQAVTNAKLRGSNDEQILKNTQDMLALKSQALAGDSKAYGKLLKLGEIKPDISAQAYNSFSPDQKQKFLGTLYGAESDASKAQRTTGVATHLMSEGYFSSPADAAKAAAVIAEGGTLPPDLQQKMRPTSLGDMVKEVGIAGTLFESGFTGGMVAQYARLGNLGGLANVLPTDFQSIQQQQIALKKGDQKIQQQDANTSSTNAATSRMSVAGIDKKNSDGTITHTKGTLEIQEDEAQARKLSAENIANRIQATAKTQSDKDFIASYNAMVDIKRAGGAVDPGMMNYMQERLVKQTGGEVTIDQAKDFWNYVTFGVYSGTHPVMKIGASPEGAAKTFGVDPNAADTSDSTSDPATAGAGSPQ